MLDTLILGLKTTFLGMGVVFLGLVFLQFMLIVLARVAGPRERPGVAKAESPVEPAVSAPAPEPQAITQVQSQDGHEQMAAIAAVLAILTAEGFAQPVIRSVRKVEPSGPSLWALAGRMGLMGGR